MAYYLRHGQCLANAQHIFAGQEDDSELTPLGEQQPLQAAKDAQGRGLRIARIICSPLRRARHTAQLFAEAFGLDPAVVQIDSRLLERKMGVVSGKPYNEAPEGDWSKLPGVEPLGEVCERVLSFWREHKDDADLLVVGHDGAQKVLEALRQQLPLENLPALPSFPQDKVVEVELGRLDA